MIQLNIFGRFTADNPSLKAFVLLQAEMELPRGNSYRSKRRRIQMSVNDNLSEISRLATAITNTPLMDHLPTGGDMSMSQDVTTTPSVDHLTTGEETPVSLNGTTTPSMDHFTTGGGISGRASAGTHAPAPEVLIDTLDYEMDSRGTALLQSEGQDAGDQTFGNAGEGSEDRPECNGNGVDSAERLKKLAVKHNLPQAVVNDVLDLLNDLNVPGLPKDARTLMKSGGSVSDVVSKAGGRYFYFGIESTLKTMASKMKNSRHKTMTLQVNIDGMPLFKSSRSSLWPILFNVKEWKKGEVFMAAIFCGVEKPSPVHEFMEDFIHEMNKLETDGIEVNGVGFKVVLQAIICDAPARAFIKCIKGHTGYNGCERCSQTGEHVSGRMTYPENSSKLRTDKSFRGKEDEDHHTGDSPLLHLDIDLVSSVP